MFEGDGRLHVGVGLLLEGQLDIAAYRATTCFESSTTGVGVAAADLQAASKNKPNARSA